MAKTVFRPNEVTSTSGEKVILQLSLTFAAEEPVEIVEEVPEYAGPTADDLRREAEAFKAHWESEKQQMMDDARAEADKIRADAEQAAFEEVRRKTDQAQVLRQQAEDEAAEKVKQAEQRAAAIEAEASQNRENEKNAAYREGFEKGREDGFREGSVEVQRLTDRVHTILEKTMDKREEILAETEQQIVDLVLLMTRKVIKVISENQRNIVVANIVQALRKVKGRGDVVIRVNLADVGLTTQHTKDFIKSVENVRNITVMEDSTVDRGGCIIETDFGSIDARISSQLNELEQKILEISPIRTRVKNSSIPPETQAAP